MRTSDEGTSVPTPRVCLACKVRHRKCEWDGSDTCGQCRLSGTDCTPQPTFQFRYHPKQKALSSQTDETTWLPGPSRQTSLRFFDETPDLLAIYNHEPSPHGTATDDQEQRAANDVLQPSISNGGSRISPLAQSPASFSLPVDSSSLTSVAPSGTDPTPSTAYSASRLPTSLDNLSQEDSALDPTEAFLLRNFTDRMAQWTDIADPFRTFETEVSRLALTDATIRYAICAFSARHYYRCQRGEEGDAEALAFQSMCFELLIPAMSGGQQINESVLVAVGLLRQNEEMDEQDNRFHAEGASRILNMVPEFASRGGVGEAACWLCLREEIYISLTNQTPIKVGLECFLDSASIRRNDDQSWASKSILNLAFLLNRVFRNAETTGDITTSEMELAEWEHMKSNTYRPIFYRPRSRRQGRSFPDIWTLAPYHAMGLQYYYIAQIVLNAVGPPQTLQPYDYLAAAGMRQRKIRNYLYAVLGLATSNEKAENTWFTARHCLSVWGGYIRHREDQLAVLDFLENWRQRSAWKTSMLVESLHQQWRDGLDDSDE